MIRAKRNKRVFGLLVLGLLVLLAHPFMATAGVCEEAVGRCVVEAVISGIFGGSPALFAHATGCVVGYQWCLKYYVPGQ